MAKIGAKCNLTRELEIGAKPHKSRSQLRIAAAPHFFFSLACFPLPTSASSRLQRANAERFARRIQSLFAALQALRLLFFTFFSVISGVFQGVAVPLQSAARLRLGSNV